MPAATVPLTVEQGSDFRQSIAVTDDDGKPVPLAGWRAVGHVRRTATGPLLYELVVTVSLGQVTVTIPGVDSAAWVWRTARYEIKLFGPSNQMVRAAKGQIVVDPELTHE